MAIDLRLTLSLYLFNKTEIILDKSRIEIPTKDNLQLFSH